MLSSDMNINEKFLQNAGKDFWDECDTVFKTLQNSSGFKLIWDLVELFPRQFDKKEIDDLHDRVLVVLSNKNKIVKRIDPGCKIFMILSMAKEIFNNDHLAHLRDGLKGISFKSWYENGTLDVFRGVSRMSDEHNTNPPTGLTENEYRSFCLTEDYAKRFTQASWGNVKKENKDTQNGWICRMTAKVQDIHIFCELGNEDEVVIKGPRNYVEVKKIRKGQLL